MRSQRSLLIGLLILVLGLAVLLVFAMRSPVEGARLADEPEEPVPAQRRPAGEPIEPGEERTPLAAAGNLAPEAAQSRARTGPPLKVFGRITDEHGRSIDEARVVVYDAVAGRHVPEVLREGWYECTLTTRGRALVVATHPDHCPREVPLELMDHDGDRHIDLGLAARVELGIHLRDPQGKPLPRFPRDRPPHAPLRAIASIETPPQELPAHAVLALSDEADLSALGWGVFEADSLLHTLIDLADGRISGHARTSKRSGNESRRRRRERDAALAEYGRALSELDEQEFEQGIERTIKFYRSRAQKADVPLDDDPERRFLMALGYIGEDGRLVEGSSPQRDRLGTLELSRALPLRVSLLAGQRVLESRELVPGTEDLTFTVDPDQLAEPYVPTRVFVSDSKTGARIRGARVHLHVEPLGGGTLVPDFAGHGRGNPGQMAHASMGMPKGWRFPDADALTDADGRADFHAATPGWWRLTVQEPAHVPVSKWVRVPRLDDCDLGFVELAPLATNRLRVADAAGAGVRASFVVRPLLHAQDRAGTLERWYFESNPDGELVLADVGLQHLLLRSADEHWALAPRTLDNTLGLVHDVVLRATPARRVLVHLPGCLPWSSLVRIVTSENQPVHEEGYGGRTIVELWVADGAYTLQVVEGPTTLLTTKFDVAGESLLVELVR